MSAPKVQLIEQAPNAWRLWSVWLGVALAVLSAVQAEVLPLIEPLFAPHAWPWVSGGVALAIVVVRLIKQDLPPVTPPPNADLPPGPAP